MKILYALLSLSLLALPMQASAMTRPVFISAVQAPNTTTQRWMAFEMNGNTTPFGNSTNAAPMAINGTVANLYVQLTTAPGSGNTWTFTLYDQTNGVDTTLTCTVADLNTTCSDLTHQVSVTAGTRYNWHVDHTGTVAATNVKMSATLAGDTAGETYQGGVGFTTHGAGTYYLAPYGGVDTATESGLSVRAPTQYTIDRLYFAVSSSASTGSHTLTVFVNGSSTNVSATINAGSDGASDLTHSITVYPDDTISMQYVNSDTVTRFPRWGYRITPAIDGEFPLVAAYNNIIGKTANRYMEIQGSMASNVSESSAQMIAPIDFTLKKAHLYIEPAPGSSSSWLVTSRIDGASGNLSATWTGLTDTGGNDLTHSDSVTAGQLVNWMTDPTNSPTSSTKLMFSAVAYITPPSSGPPAPAGPANSQFKILGGLFRILGGHLLIR